MLDEKIRQEIIPSNIDHYSTDQIILFVGYAAGSPHTDSDIDLIIRQSEIWRESDSIT